MKVVKLNIVRNVRLSMQWPIVTVVGASVVDDVVGVVVELVVVGVVVVGSGSVVLAVVVFGFGRIGISVDVGVLTGRSTLANFANAEETIEQKLNKRGRMYCLKIIQAFPMNHTGNKGRSWCREQSNFLQKKVCPLLESGFHRIFLCIFSKWMAEMHISCDSCDCCFIFAWGSFQT